MIDQIFWIALPIILTACVMLVTWQIKRPVESNTSKPINTVNGASILSKISSIDLDIESFKKEMTRVYVQMATISANQDSVLRELESQKKAQERYDNIRRKDISSVHTKIESLLRVVGNEHSS